MKYVIYLILLCVLVGCPPSGLGEPNPNFLVIGHRGAPNVEAENTLPSFEKALQLGANSIELDLCMTADNWIVVWHDRDPDDAVAVARQVGAEGLAYIPAVPPVGSTFRRPVDQLTVYDFMAHYGYARLGGQRDPSKVIPTLEDLMTWTASKTALRVMYVDVKLAAEQTYRAASLVERVIEQRERTGGGARVELRFISPQKDIVTAMEQTRQSIAAERVRVAWDFEEPGSLSGAKSLGLRDTSLGITPQWTWTRFVEEVSGLVEAREDGELDSVTVWTIDRRKDMALLLYHGVDGIMTNEPKLLYDIWQQTLTEE